MGKKIVLDVEALYLSFIPIISNQDWKPRVQVLIGKAPISVMTPEEAVQLGQMIIDTAYDAEAQGRFVKFFRTESEDFKPEQLVSFLQGFRETGRRLVDGGRKNRPPEKFDEDSDNPDREQ